MNPSSFMKEIPQGSPSYQRRNPHLFRHCPPDRDDRCWREDEEAMNLHGKWGFKVGEPPKPVLNKTETRYCGVLESRGLEVMKQAITLRLDPPYKSYKPDLAYLGQFGLTLVEVKGPHRFRKAGIAKAALAAKTYPQFRFELADWANGEWKESVLSS